MPFSPQRQLDQQAWWIFNQKVEKISLKASCPVAFQAPFSSYVSPLSDKPREGRSPRGNGGLYLRGHRQSDKHKIRRGWRGNGGPCTSLDNKLCTHAGTLLRVE